VRRVLVDSGGFCAHLVAEDSNHTRAQALFVRAEHERWDLVTTNAVVYETHALLINRQEVARSSCAGRTITH
jgi:predicted nucleic acid-binding protein